MYHFKVKSPDTVFDVTGTGALRKPEREIWAIGQLKQVTKSQALLATAITNQKDQGRAGDDPVRAGTTGCGRRTPTTSDGTSA
jgi:hypothetical protein